ncbi:MAG TPA: DUF6498-containing protein [Methylomirabilota bacterium]|nr:DUF6498-containing protein [Methylomirabilota bacterium]
MIARAVRIAQAASTTTSVLVLIAFNLIPLVGVLFGRWSVATLLVLYWVENGIAGILNVPKILLAEGTGQTAPTGRTVGAVAVGALTRLPLALFFVVHYGLFWLVHGVFVMTLPSLAGGGAIRQLDPGPGSSPFVFDPLGMVGTPAVGPDWSAVAWGALGLAISHGFSFLANFVGRGEYRKVSSAEQMGRAYGRVVVLHLAILFGGFLSLAIGSPVGALLVLVLLKTAIDVALHRREHAELAGRRPLPAG